MGAVTVVLSSAVVRPVADAGTNRTVAAGTTGVQMNGTPSDGGGAGAPYTHAWRIITDTTGGAVLSSTTIEDPTLDLGPTAGQVELGYTVTDSASVESLEDTVTITGSAAGNISVPIEAITDSGWGFVDTNTVDAVADGIAATYVFHDNATIERTIEWKMGPLSPAAAGDRIVIRYNPSIFQAVSGEVTVVVVEGATVRATFDPDVWSDVEQVQEFVHEMSEVEIGTVTDWSDVRVRLQGLVTV